MLLSLKTRDEVCWTSEQSHSAKWVSRRSMKDWISIETWPDRPLPLPTGWASILVRDRRVRSESIAIYMFSVSEDGSFGDCAFVHTVKHHVYLTPTPNREINARSPLLHAAEPSISRGLDFIIPSRLDPDMTRRPQKPAVAQARRDRVVRTSSPSPIDHYC
jgi:hypothetical protein